MTTASAYAAVFATANSSLSDVTITRPKLTGPQMTLEVTDTGDLRVTANNGSISLAPAAQALVVGQWLVATFG